jgi:hypothetical protein
MPIGIETEVFSMSSTFMSSNYPTTPPPSKPGYLPGTLNVLSVQDVQLDDLNRLTGRSVNLVVRRRTSLQQGQALEVLGHAIEYLIDSRMFFIDRPSSRADSDAIHLLMLRSRQIFRECIEVVPPAQRLRAWISSQLDVSAN